MIQPIVAYELGWNPETNKGAIKIRFLGGQERLVNVNSAEEFTAVATVLKESPVGYNTENGFIVTGWEQVGG